MDAGPSRVRPTASARRRRGRHDEPEIYDAPSPPAETVYQDIPPMDDDDAGAGPCPGGPEDVSVLISFRTHIAASIWRQEERAPLKCMNHAAKVREWQWWASDQSNGRFRALVQQSGLVGLVRCSYRFTDKILVSGFVERWQPETNTFHLPFGEMTITLDDIAAILGISVGGAPVSCDRMSDWDAEDLLVELLGVTRADARQEVQLVRGQSVRMEWLKSQFSVVSDRDSHRRIECAARGYILFLLGCTLFVDKSGTRVPIAFLSLLRDLDRVSTYAWGAAALAFLYRQLGVASRASVRQMSGYMTLLQAWIYEHFPTLSPHPSIEYTDEMPRVHRWIPGTPSRTTMDHLVVLRETLDVLTADEVVWDPLHHIRHDRPFEDIAFFSGCLKCTDVVEPYHPERVLRQFGRIQTIPRAPLAPVRATRGTTAASYRIAYVFLDQMWERWEDHVLSRASRSIPVTRPSDCVPEFMEWFSTITHIAVQPPERRSGIYPRDRGHIVDDRDRRLADAERRIADVEGRLAESERLRADSERLRADSELRTADIGRLLADSERRNADGLRICSETLRLDRHEATSTLGADHLYDSISHISHLLQGQHFSADQPDEPGPSHPPRQYSRRRRRGGD